MSPALWTISALHTFHFSWNSWGQKMKTSCSTMLTNSNHSKIKKIDFDLIFKIHEKSLNLCLSLSLSNLCQIQLTFGTELIWSQISSQSELLQCTWVWVLTLREEYGPYFILLRKMLLGDFLLVLQVVRKSSYIGHRLGRVVVYFFIDVWTFLK